MRIDGEGRLRALGDVAPLRRYADIFTQIPDTASASTHPRLRYARVAMTAGNLQCRERLVPDLGF